MPSGVLLDVDRRVRAGVGPPTGAPVDVGADRRREAEHADEPELSRGRGQAIERGRALFPHLAYELREREELDRIDEVRNRRRTTTGRINASSGRDRPRPAAVARRQPRDRARADRRQSRDLVGSLGDFDRPIAELDRPLELSVHREQSRRATEQRDRRVREAVGRAFAFLVQQRDRGLHVGVPSDRHAERERVVGSVFGIGVGHGLAQQRRGDLGRVGLPRGAAREEEPSGAVGVRCELRRAARSKASTALVAAPARDRASPAASSAVAACFVGTVGRGAEMPRRAIVVAGGRERLREHLVRTTALRRLDAVERGRAQQRMRELSQQTASG